MQPQVNTNSDMFSHDRGTMLYPSDRGRGKENSKMQMITMIFLIMRTTFQDHPTVEHGDRTTVSGVLIYVPTMLPVVIVVPVCYVVYLCCEICHDHLERPPNMG